MLCVGGSVTLTATVTGGSSAQVLQWQTSPNGTSGWANISGANATTFMLLLQALQVHFITGQLSRMYYPIVVIRYLKLRK
jgi:hypothetical protein